MNSTLVKSSRPVRSGWPNVRNPRDRRSLAQARYDQLIRLKQGTQPEEVAADDDFAAAFAAAAVAIKHLGESKKGVALREKLQPSLARIALEDPSTATLARIAACVESMPFVLDFLYGNGPSSYYGGTQRIPNYADTELCTTRRPNGLWYRKTTAERNITAWADDGSLRQAWGTTLVTNNDYWSLPAKSDGSFDAITARQIPFEERLVMAKVALDIEDDMLRIHRLEDSTPLYDMPLDYIL